MVPTITLVGRSNVGKSTLFNRLTGTCDALIGVSHDILTRDRRYGSFIWKKYRAIIVDTGGVDTIENKGIERSIFNQSQDAILEADLILFVVDGKIGLVSFDYEIVHYLYQFKKVVFVVVNKVDNFYSKYKGFEFYNLGLKKVIPISAIHGCGIDILSEEIFFNLDYRKLLSNNDICNERVKQKFFLKNPSFFLKRNEMDIIVLAIVGAPNVGKSTFLNYVLGENRVIVSDSPGTTRDNVCVSMLYNGNKYILIDTAGLRRKNRVTSCIEKLAISRTLKILKSVTVVLLFISADRGVCNDDLSLINNILRSGKSLVIGVNKWDLLSSSDLQKQFIKIFDRRMNFVRFVDVNYVSALYGDGISDLFKSIVKAHRVTFKTMNTSFLTRIMHSFVDRHYPPFVYGKQIRLKYAHLGGRSPLIIVVHGYYATGLPENYKRYLVNCFSRILNISHLSIRILFRNS